MATIKKIMQMAEIGGTITKMILQMATNDGNNKENYANGRDWWHYNKDDFANGSE